MEKISIVFYILFCAFAGLLIGTYAGAFTSTESFGIGGNIEKGINTLIGALIGIIMGIITGIVLGIIIISWQDNGFFIIVRKRNKF
jgi:hypothetical protein